MTLPLPLYGDPTAYVVPVPLAAVFQPAYVYPDLAKPPMFVARIKSTPSVLTWLYGTVPLVLLFALSGSLMISRIRIPKL